MSQNPYSVEEYLDACATYTAAKSALCKNTLELAKAEARLNREIDFILNAISDPSGIYEQTADLRSITHDLSWEGPYGTAALIEGFIRGRAALYYTWNKIPDEKKPFLKAPEDI